MIMFSSFHKPLILSNSEMRLDFSPKTVGEWRALLQKSSKTSCNQTYQYAIAMAKAAHHSTLFASIIKNQETIGVVSVQEATLGPIQHLKIYRGPLFFQEHETIENLLKFSKVLINTFPRRPLRKLKWLPEWNLNDETIQKITSASGLSCTDETFETIWLDLKAPLEIIKQRFHRKWRRDLYKAEGSPIEVTVDTQGRHLKEFLRNYDHFKSLKKFDGPNGNFMSHEIEKSLPFGDALILWARIQGVPVAGIVVIKHGHTASYRIAWNTPEGRSHNAHFLLLWRAIELLKKLNIQFFDLGGILSNDKNNFNTFKLRMNGALMKTGVFS